MAQDRPRLNMYDPQVYRIRVDGRLPAGWSSYFDAQSVLVQADQHGLPSTTLVSNPVDQAALLGICNYLSTLGLPVASVECLGQPTQADHSPAE